MKIVEVVQTLASREKSTPSQIALAWLLHKGNDIVPIPGTKKRRYLEENLKATQLVLSKAALETLDKALPEEGASGDRYNTQHMSFIDT